MDGPLLSVPRLLQVRVKGNKMRGKGGGPGASGGGECGRRRTTPGEDSLRDSVSVEQHAHEPPELGGGKEKGGGGGSRQRRTSSSSLDLCHD